MALACFGVWFHFKCLLSRFYFQSLCTENMSRSGPCIYIIKKNASSRTKRHTKPHWLQDVGRFPAVFWTIPAWTWSNMDNPHFFESKAKLRPSCAGLSTRWTPSSGLSRNGLRWAQIVWPPSEGKLGQSDIDTPELLQYVVVLREQSHKVKETRWKKRCFRPNDGQVLLHPWFLPWLRRWLATWLLASDATRSSSAATVTTVGNGCLLGDDCPV